MHQPSPHSLRDRLLDQWQRGFPLVSRPFEVIARHLGSEEDKVIETLESLKSEGAISRVGGVIRPNTLGASTLAAIAAPDFQVAPVAGLLCSEPGVNHVYLRENELNLWFVVTGPDRTHVDRVLGRVRDKTGLAVLDLRLERAYHIDLGFALNGCEGERAPGSRVRPTLHGTYVPQRLDRALAQTLSDGLPLVPQTFARAGEQLGCSEADVIGRLHVLVESGIVPRIGVIVRHRALGWRSNAMVVWDAPRDQADRAGEVLAEAPGINLCYRRTRYEREWPYSLYCMVHARSRDEALAKLVIAEALAGLQGVPRQILFSTRCYRQTGAMLGLPREAA